MTMGSGLSEPTSRPTSETGASDLADALQPAVRVRSLRKAYGGVVALAGVDLEIEQGQFFTLLGPSGSGKTTLLRLIAGFERAGAVSRTGGR